MTTRVTGAAPAIEMTDFPKQPTPAPTRGSSLRMLSLGDFFKNDRVTSLMLSAAPRRGSTDAHSPVLSNSTRSDENPQQQTRKCSIGCPNWRDKCANCVTCIFSCLSCGQI